MTIRPQTLWRVPVFCAVASAVTRSSAASEAVTAAGAVFVIVAHAVAIGVDIVAAAVALARAAVIADPVAVGVNEA